MSDQPEATQTDLPGMPETKTIPSFLYVCEFGVDDFATATVMTSMLRHLPGVDDGDNELFEKAGQKIARYVREQVGRRVFEAAIDDAYERLGEVMAQARKRTDEEGHPR